MVYGCTRERVSIYGEYSSKILDTDLSVVPGDLYTMALTRPRVTCRRYTMLPSLLLKSFQVHLHVHSLAYFQVYFLVHFLVCFLVYSEVSLPVYFRLYAL